MATPFKHCIRYGRALGSVGNRSKTYSFWLSLAVNIRLNIRHYSVVVVDRIDANLCYRPIGLTKPGGLIANTEQSIWFKIVSAVLPIKKPATPVRATVPITMRSTSGFTPLPDPELVDLIEQAFLEGQIDGQKVDLAHSWLQTNREVFML